LALRALRCARELARCGSCDALRGECLPCRFKTSNESGERYAGGHAERTAEERRNVDILPGEAQQQDALSLSFPFDLKLKRSFHIGPFSTDCRVE
jgi:hypothetical protein